MKRFLFATYAVLLLAACHSHHEKEGPAIAKRTVLVYIAAENSLNNYAFSDVSEMMDGSLQLSPRDNLILFWDMRDKNPRYYKVENGDTIGLYTCEENLRTSDAQTLASALDWTMTNYEAEEYGLVLWGHADGWIIKDNTAASRPRRSYGQDLYPTEQWMNIPDMASQLNTMLTAHGQNKLKFIFADCCCFQSIESAYELRNSAEYIIASAAEIPGEGAPYKTVIPALFSQDPEFYKTAMDAYYEQLSYGFREPLSVIKTDKMEDLAAATRTALTQNLQPISDAGYPKTDSLIYYYNHTLFDMNDFMLASIAAQDYTEWNRVFCEAVPYITKTDSWLANFVPMIGQTHLFRDFDVTTERMSCVSMFVPQDVQLVNYTYQRIVDNQNKNINKMQWYKAAGLDVLGW